MSEPWEAPNLETVVAEPRIMEAETSGAANNVAVLPAPSHSVKEVRPVTNLGKVFGQFVALQQQIAEQVGVLEASVSRQKQDLADAAAQLPELHERIDWLIAAFSEQSKRDEAVRDRLDRHDAAIRTLTDTVQAMADQKKRWQAAFDEVIAALVRAKAALDCE